MPRLSRVDAPALPRCNGSLKADGLFSLHGSVPFPHKPLRILQAHRAMNRRNSARGVYNFFSTFHRINLMNAVLYFLVPISKTNRILLKLDADIVQTTDRINPNQ